MKCKISYNVEFDVNKSVEELGLDVSQDFIDKFKKSMIDMKDELKKDLDEALPCDDDESTLTIELIEEEETINE
jgi:hypothetical protein